MSQLATAVRLVSSLVSHVQTHEILTNDETLCCSWIRICKICQV